MPEVDILESEKASLRLTDFGVLKSHYFQFLIHRHLKVLQQNIKISPILVVCLDVPFENCYR